MKNKGMDKEKPTFGRDDVEILASERRYTGFLSIDRLTVRHRLFRGGWSPAYVREVMRRRSGVGVLLYDPDLDKVLMVEQFRAGCLDNSGGPWVLELVAGILDTGESPEEVAVREAREEAGVAIGSLIPVCEYYTSPGGTDEKLAVFCAKVDARRAGGVFGVEEEHEDIRTVILDREAAEAGVREGRINNAMAIIAIQWLSSNLQEVRGLFRGSTELP